MTGHTRQVLVPMDERHYSWLLEYAALHQLSVDGVVRIAIRTHNMLELTPGALDAVVALRPRWAMSLAELVDV